MLQKSLAKFIKSLQLKKYRKSEQSFIVEGKKSVEEVLNSDYRISHLLGTAAYLENTSSKSNNVEQTIQVSSRELNQVGNLKNNNEVLAVVRMKQEGEPVLSGKITLLLDDLNDPGNLGTIIRIADWYGIKEVICSDNTVDIYNPKVISSTKGSFTRVNTFYKNLETFIPESKLPLYGADLSGESVHTFKPIFPCMLIVGNEANGIRVELEKLLTTRITIPAYGSAESLNAAIATAVVCDNLLRN